MKVNVYDSENIQKGRMMLLNMAEDLKEYCRISVQPKDPRKKQEKSIEAEKRPDGITEIAEAVDKQRKNKEEMNIILNQVEDESDIPDYLYMELRSTASFKDVDIDAMVEMTTLDQFMSGIFQ